MSKIYETENFIVESAEKPFIDRLEGGHLRIYPKKTILDRTELSPKLAIEFIRLTMIIGKAMAIALTKRGIEIMRINYQDMGNWAFMKGEKPYFHMHIFGRAKNAKHQPYKESVYLPYRSTGFYDGFDCPFNDDDVKAIREQMELIFKEEKYQDSNWSLK